MKRTLFKWFRNFSVMDLRDMRKSYRGVEEKMVNLGKDPIENFRLWFLEAKEACSFEEANAMSLATSTKDGKPSCRPVLLKALSDRGFEFYTNYNSRKAKELDENPVAAATFYWAKFNRSIRIEGPVEKVPTQVSEEYWARRPVESQASACSSPQSRPVPSREILEAEKAAVHEKYTKNNIPIPRPDFWGGYVLVPDSFEFWQGQSDRLHDRILFRKNFTEEDNVEEGENGWKFQRLGP